MKYICLITRRLLNKFKVCLFHSLSYIFLFFSVIVCLFILYTNIVNVSPAFSYIIKKRELPLAYTMYGDICIIDSAGNTINNNVVLYVGGYKVEIGTSSKYKLVFSSPITDVFYANIQYENQNMEKKEFTKCLTILNNSTEIQEDFIIYEEI